MAGRVSVEVSPASGRESGIHRNPRYADRLIALPFENEPSVNTVVHVLQRSASKFPNRPFLGHRPKQGDKLGEYVWCSYADGLKDILNIGLGLKGLCGLNSSSQGPQQSRVGIFSVNRPEWTKSFLGAMSQRIVIVPLYDTLGPDSIQYIIQHAELTTVLFERNKMDSLLKGKGSGAFSKAVMFEDATEEEKAKCRAAGITLYSLSEIIRAGASGVTAPASAPSSSNSNRRASGPMPGAPMPQPGMQQPGAAPPAPYQHISAQMPGYGPGHRLPPMPMQQMAQASTPSIHVGTPTGYLPPMAFPPPQQAVWGVGFQFGNSPKAGGSVSSAGPSPSDWAYIMYTSGTTGEPKGVVLTHQNVLAPVAGMRVGTDPEQPFPNEEDVYISFLPLAHIYECNMQMCCVCAGAAIGFFTGDPVRLLQEDVPMLKPTLMAAVPRIYGRIHDKVIQGMEKKGFLVKTLYRMAIKSQKKKVAQGTRSGFWDKKIFSKVQAAFGGRIRVMASGAAPLGADVHEWTKCAFGCPVLQGYGMTENAGAAVCMSWRSTTIGTVGGPLPCCETKLMDTDTYTSRDQYPLTAADFERQFTFKGEFTPALAGKTIQRGEVCLRGPNISLGYFKNEKDTKEVFDAQGWLHTGDIGQWNEDGSLSIIDRKKNIFKLSQGEYVAPDSTEAVLTLSKYILQIFVYGNSFETCTVAIVVPDKETLGPWCASKGLAGSNLREMCSHPQVKQLILQEIEMVGKGAKLRGFELPKDVAFETETNALGQGFTIENECLTPTFKARRPQLQRRYQKQIDAMYAALKKK